MAGLEAVEFDAAGKGSDGAGNQAQQGGFAAGIRTEDGHEFAFAGLKGSGFEGEEWRGLFARRIGITGLLDIDAQVRRMARSGRGGGGVRDAWRFGPPRLPLGREN